MTSYVALYRGEGLGRSTLVAVSSDPDLVQRFADELLAGRDQGQASPTGDPAQDAVTDGKRKALEIVREEAAAERGPTAGT